MKPIHATHFQPNDVIKLDETGELMQVLEWSDKTGYWYRSRPSADAPWSEPKQGALRPMGSGESEHEDQLHRTLPTREPVPTNPVQPRHSAHPADAARAEGQVMEKSKAISEHFGKAAEEYGKPESWGTPAIRSDTFTARNVTILDKAKDLIYGDRASAYGEYSDEARKLAQVFSVILGVEVPPEKVPLLMVGLKMVRLSQNPTHSDSWLDIAGYAGCAGKLDSIWGDQ